jgi:acetamidase/formamidase
MGRLHIFAPAKYMLTYGPNAPALRVKAGDSVRVKTVDARGRDERGRRVPPARLQSREGTDLLPSNPLVGPFHIEGAEPGDTLIVKIARIELNRPTAWASSAPDFGAFTGETPGRRMLVTPRLREERFTWRLDLRRKTGTLDLRRSRQRKVTVPLEPFIGSIGVAPRYGRVETALTPGEYGGNMDCIETRQGVTIHFPVFVCGGLLAFGDVHAAQGDGEICGSALETTAEVTLRFDLLKGKPLDWPRMEDRDWLMTVGNARPLLDALRIAFRQMLDWLVEDYGFDSRDAMQLLSQAGRARIGNVCDPNYSVVYKVRKSLFA